jgi:hypothetical protein
MPMTFDSHAYGTPRAGGSVLGLTRLSLWPLFVLAAANGLFLYLLPDQAVHYAWPIKPPINSAFMGAGYLAGLVAGGVAIFGAQRWRSFATLSLPFAVLGTVMLAATLIHAPLFRWDYPPTWLWTAVYVAVPPAAVWLWLRQRRSPDDPTPPDGLAAASRWAAWPLGLVLIGLGLLLLAAPAPALAAWPWPITTLLSRAFAGWHLLIGGILVASALTARGRQDLPIPFLTVAAWSALVLLLPLVYAGTLRTGGPYLWSWVALQALVLAGSLGFAVAALAGMRRAGQRL